MWRSQILKDIVYSAGGSAIALGLLVLMAYELGAFRDPLPVKSEPLEEVAPVSPPLSGDVSQGPAAGSASADSPLMMREREPSVYIWTDERGVRQFADRPPVGRPYERKPVSQFQPSLYAGMPAGKARALLNEPAKPRVFTGNRSPQTVADDGLLPQCRWIAGRIRSLQKLIDGNDDGKASIWLPERSERCREWVSESCANYQPPECV